MKRVLSVLVAGIFTLTCFGIVMAAEQKMPEKKVPPDPPPVAAPAAVAPAGDNVMKKEGVKKGKPMVVTGTVEAVDAADGTISVKGKKETVHLKAGEKVMLGEFKVGDKVTVTYSEGVATKVVAAKKAVKKKKAEEKKAE